MKKLLLFLLILLSPFILMAGNNSDLTISLDGELPLRKRGGFYASRTG